MNKDLSFLIDKENENISVYDFLKKNNFSTKLIKHLKNTPMGIEINNKLIFTNYLLKKGDNLNIHIAEEKPSEFIIPKNIPFNIVYEDEDILVVNKDGKTNVHPCLGDFENTLANGICYYYKEKDSPFVFRAVGRLDRQTSGLVLIAKNLYSSMILSDMIKKKKITRKYIAVCEGQLYGEGYIEAPILRENERKLKRVVNEKGDYAKTYFKTLKTYNEFSLVELELFTGRTHQIRVHLNYIGHPLVGDFLYGKESNLISRQALHCCYLKFNHPVSNKEVIINCNLPKDIENLIKE